MAICKTEAIVLKTFDFRETSIIANFYTRDFGRISGVLKGIRKEPAKFASSLEPFSINEIIFYRKTNSTLHLVSQADLKDNFSGIRNNMFKMVAANILAELIYAVCAEDDTNEEIFNLSLACLKALETSADADKVMTIFKIKLLVLSGFKPHFDSCVSCAARILGESKFSASSGGLLCPDCYSKDPKSHMIFRGTIASILYIERNDFKNNLNLGLNPQIKKELIFALNSFLNFHLGKKLKSEEVAINLKNYSSNNYSSNIDSRR